MDDEHERTISQRHEEAQEANFSIRRPKAALLKEVQPKHANAGPAAAAEEEEEEGAEERVQVQLSPKAVLVDEATLERNQVEARSPPSGPSGGWLSNGILNVFLVGREGQSPPGS